MKILRLTWHCVDERFIFDFSGKLELKSTCQLHKGESFSSSYMISKINWPYSHKKGNPFGGPNGFRDLRITFDSGSFDNASPNELKALEILYGLARLDDIDTVSFGMNYIPKLSFGVWLENFGKARILEDIRRPTFRKG